MTKRILAFLLVGYVCFFLHGCTSRNWYEGLKEMQRQDCYKIESQTERQKCLDKADEQTYDQYKKDREASIKDAGQK